MSVREVSGGYGPLPASNTMPTPVRGGYATLAGGYESASSSDTVKSSSTVHIPDNSSPNTTLSANGLGGGNSSSNSSSNLGEELRSGDAKSTYFTDFDYKSDNNQTSQSRNSINENGSNHMLPPHVPTEANMLRHERLAALKSSPQSETCVTTEHDRLTIPSQRSEDELSSSSQSPARPRNAVRRNTNGGGATTPSSTTSNSSRGHSPRTVNGLPDSFGGGSSTAAKKKVGRSARNSANLTSTLQEDLMKLISPDYNNDDSGAALAATKTALAASATQQNGVKDSPLSKLPKKTLSELSLMKSRSRENIARLEDNVSNEVHCFTMAQARPVTVISSSSLTSPGTADNSRLNISTASSAPETSTLANSASDKSSTVLRTSPVSKTSRPADVEWTSLVDTATKAMLSSPEEDTPPQGAISQSLPQGVGAVPNSLSQEVAKLQVSTVQALEGGKVAGDDRHGVGYSQLLDRVQGLEEQLLTERAGKEQLSGQVIIFNSLCCYIFGYPNLKYL